MGVLVKKGECDPLIILGEEGAGSRGNELCERMRAELSGCPRKEGEARVAKPAGYRQRTAPRSTWQMGGPV